MATERLAGDSRAGTAIALADTLGEGEVLWEVDEVALAEERLEAASYAPRREGAVELSLIHI